MSKKTILGVGCAVVVLLTGCSAAGPKNVCADKNVKCDPSLTCDPADGVCKCGGRGGVICRDGFICNPDSNTCQSTKCIDGACDDSPGTTCDQFDGTCKCGGTGGTVCKTNELCDANARLCVAAVDCNQVACPRNQTCDVATGHCTCGTNECTPSQYCSPDSKTCVGNLCGTVTCSGATVCDPSDGHCKCAGVFCQSGEACACPAGADGGSCASTERVCHPGTSCNGVVCPATTTCDPVDGTCKCGGPGGPVCASNQICSLNTFQCQGGEQCGAPDGGSKLCAGGLSCDPEDGKCKCGGRGGNECAAMTVDNPAEICISSSSLQKSCKRPCDVRTPDCPTGTSCYFDSAAATPAAYCSAPTGSQGVGSACTSATSCFGPVTTGSSTVSALHCVGLAPGQPGQCGSSYCSVALGTSGCPQAPKPHTCDQIAGAPSDYGYCREH